MKDNLLYRIVRTIVGPIIKFLYRPIIIGAENIPKDGRIILAGNHKHNLDSLLLAISTKRQVHFLAKKELTTGKFGFFIRGLGVIPVDRSKKNPDALEKAKEMLNEDRVIGIFPESTFNRTADIIIPFKVGAVKMASETKTRIVPFAITGDYKIRKQRVKIEFLPPYVVNMDNIDKENKKLESIVSELITKNR